MTLQRESVSADQHAYNYILGEIRSGRMAGGTRLKSEKIAKAIGVSRIPVRGAMRQLESEGFITIRPNRGAVVTALGPDDVGELFEIRSVLEALSARISTPMFDKNALDDLRDLLVRLNRARDDTDLWIKRHFEFHHFLCSMSKRRRLISEITKFNTLCEPYMRLWYTKSDRTKKDVDEHRDIIEAIETGDPNKAESVVREHIARGAVQLRAFFRSNPEVKKRTRLRVHA
ncbi:MAG TPA: GntR family transcriptional regulator [Dongiaceae bacterium]|jgi:DNA-binding GntR family transcriptional regulator|nr:GntR family transcriptional regulator [Dongiaceae bacterium]